MIGENKFIPDFLKPENIIIDPEMEKFGAAIEKYEKHFGEGLNTESYIWSVKEWCKIVDIVLRKKRHWMNYWGRSMIRKQMNDRKRKEIEFVNGIRYI